MTYVKSIYIKSKPLTIKPICYEKENHLHASIDLLPEFLFISKATLYRPCKKKLCESSYSKKTTSQSKKAGDDQLEAFTFLSIQYLNFSLLIK